MSLKLFEDGIEIPLETFSFPGGEVAVRLDLGFDYEKVAIEAILRTSDDVMKLLMLTDAIRRRNIKASIKLFMPYVPYARQDRVMVGGESLSIKVFCNLINSQNYERVIIWDPHSDVTPALLNNCEIVSQDELLDKQFPFGTNHTDSSSRIIIRRAFIENTVLVSPDAGANKKISESAKLIGFKHVVRADKVRDPATGKILETVVYSEHIGDKDFLIVDDICDKGGTFVALGKILRPLTNGKIILYITHAILPDGPGIFKGVIDEVYCANSFGKYAPNVNLLEGLDGS